MVDQSLPTKSTHQIEEEELDAVLKDSRTTWVQKPVGVEVIGSNYDWIN